MQHGVPGPSALAALVRDASRLTSQRIARHVLTAVAANLVGVERLLAGRPGSWEADFVRQIVLSTSGGSDEVLVRWRTKPLRLSLDVVEQLADLGLLERYDAAADSAASREDEAHQSIVLAFSAAEERARIAEIRSQRMELLGDLDATELDGERAAELADKMWAIATLVAERAQMAGIVLDARRLRPSEREEPATGPSHAPWQVAAMIKPSIRAAPAAVGVGAAASVSAAATTLTTAPGPTARVFTTHTGILTASMALARVEIRRFQMSTPTPSRALGR